MALPPVMKNKSKGVKSTSGAKAGPSNVMLGRQHTGTQKPGVSSQEQGKEGKMSYAAKGGTTKMFGKQAAKPAKPA